MKMIRNALMALLVTASLAQVGMAGDYQSDARYEELKKKSLTRSSFYPDGNSGQLELLIMAVDRDDVDTLRKLFEAAPKMVTVSEGGSRCSPIHWAAFRGYTNVLAVVLEHREDVNRTGTWQKITPLHLAHDANTARFLVEHGANLEPRETQGQTPLMWAAERGRLDVVRYLVEAGAEVDVKDENGATALYLAGMYKCTNVAEFLIQKGAKPLSERETNEIGPGVGIRINAGAPEEDHPFSSWRLISIEPIPWPVARSDTKDNTTQPAGGAYFSPAAGSKSAHP